MILILSIVASINYNIDPAQLFSGGSYEKGVAEILLSGSNVANLSNYGERLLQRAYINGLKKKRDVIVLGSSRSLGIRKELFPGMAFFNSAVSGASIEDFLAIFELYQQRNLLPSVVILGLDPWILNRNSGQTRWMSLKREYFIIADRLKIDANGSRYKLTFSSKLMELFSLQYFLESLKGLFKDRIKKRGEYYPTFENLCDEGGKLSDGSIVSVRKVRDKSKDEILMSAKKYVTGPTIYSLGNFKYLDKRSALSLEKFIEYLQAKNIRVIFYLPPYHPYVFEFLSESSKYSKVLEAENYFRRLANDKGIAIVGGYNPRNSHCGPGDFLDGMHPKDSCAENAFKNIGSRVQ